MVKPRSVSGASVFGSGIISIDIASTLGSCFLGSWLAMKFGPEISTPFQGRGAVFIVPIVFLIWLLAFFAVGAWDKRLLIAGNEYYVRTLRATFLAFGTVAFLEFLFNIDAARPFSLFALPVGVLSLLFGRWYLRARTAKNPPSFRATLLGAGHSEALYALQTETLLKLDIVDTIQTESVEQIVQRQRNFDSDLVIIGSNHGLSNFELRELMWKFDEIGVHVWFDAATSFFVSNRAVMLPLKNTALVISDARHLSDWQRFEKRIVDICISSVALVLLLPVMLVAMVAIRIGGKGPVLFKQKRIGVDGKVFTLWKLRTMTEGMRPEAPNGLSKDPDDQRITPVGRVLRRYSIDEIPQFVNVILGNMSVVGPRPRLPEEMNNSKFMSRRLRAKPGITGLWQVSGRSLISLSEAEALDVDYVDSWSLISDFVIVLRTIRVVYSGRGAF